jgi:hypothetical protein
MTVMAGRPKASWLSAFAVVTALFALDTVASLAYAQSNPAVCRQIEQQMARLGQVSAAAGGDPRFADAARRQRTEIDTTVRYTVSLGCSAGSTNGQCRALETQIQRMRANLSQLEARARSAGGEVVDRGQQRARLVAAYQANRCGASAPVERQAAPSNPFVQEDRTQAYAHVRTPAPPPQAPQTAYRASAQPSRGPANFIEFLFGQRNVFTPQPEVVPDLPAPIVVDENTQQNRGLGHRRICVRLCDGAFFPLTSSPRPGQELDEDDMCKMQCPGAEVEAFRMSDTSIENATSLSGTPYMSLPNALKYRRAFDSTCSCRPQGRGWIDAFDGQSDPTLRSGDLVVSSEQARLLSLPESQRRAVREEIQASERARRESERQARVDRRRENAGSAETVTLDGQVRAAPLPEPVNLRGSGDLNGAAVENETDRRPVRLIGPVPPQLIVNPPPRAQAPNPGAGG